MLAVAGGTAPAVGQEGDGHAVEYRPPVDAPIIDPFRPPPEPWLPGNRGIEYGTAPGTPVRAAGRGTVTFAGAVGGTLHVTVTHPDGVRTSYSFLATVTVRVGQVIALATVVGTTGSSLHVGARRGDAYIDPESLWGRRGPPRVELVPVDGGGGTGSTGGEGQVRRASGGPGWWPVGGRRLH